MSFKTKKNNPLKEVFYLDSTTELCNHCGADFSSPQSIDKNCHGVCYQAEREQQMLSAHEYLKKSELRKHGVGKYFTAEYFVKGLVLGTIALGVAAAIKNLFSSKEEREFEKNKDLWKW